MAEAYGKLTGEPGICFVTRGPGATNASIGVHTAFQDSTPMILLHRPGRPRHASSARRSRRSTTGACTARWRSGWRRSTAPSASPSTSSHAFHIATAGRPGPGGAGAARGHAGRRGATSPIAGAYQRGAGRAPAPRRWPQLRELLDEAQRPLVIVGGGGWSARGGAATAALRRGERSAGRRALPLPGLVRQPPPQLCRRRRHRHQSRSSPQRVKEADLLLVVGARLGEMTTGGYTLVDVAAAAAEARPRAPRRRGAGPRLPAGARRSMPASPRVRRCARATARASTEAAVARPASSARARLPRRGTQPRADARRRCNMGEVMRWLRERLPEDTIVTNGAGNFAGLAAPLLPYTGFRTQLAPTSGSMGYGVPGRGRGEARASGAHGRLRSRATATS